MGDDGVGGGLGVVRVVGVVDVVAVSRRGGSRARLRGVTPELNVEDRVTALEARVEALQLQCLVFTRTWWGRLQWLMLGR